MFATVVAELILRSIKLGEVVTTLPTGRRLKCRYRDGLFACGYSDDHESWKCAMVTNSPDEAQRVFLKISGK